jgi:cell division protein FtsN
VIAAPEGADKIVSPETEQASGETVGEAVYDRVAGRPQETEEQIVDNSEEPEEIRQIVLPGPQSEAETALARPVGEADGAPAEPDAPAEAAEGEAAAEPAAADNIGPRRVRTYVVRPDGSIVETGEASPAAAPSTPAAPPIDIEPIDPVTVATTALNGAGEPADPADAAPATGTPAAASTADSDAPTGELRQGAEEPAAPAPPPEEDPAERLEAALAEPTAPPEQAAAAEQPPAEPAPPAAGDNAPVDLLSAAPAQQPVPPPAASGEGWVVQVSSQRSQSDAQASWNALKSRYASVLGNLDASIQSADLGEKGVYYRVRIGPWTDRAQAVEVCEALQAAGGDCFVGR